MNGRKKGQYKHYEAEYENERTSLSIPLSPQVERIQVLFERLNTSLRYTLALFPLFLVCKIAQYINQSRRSTVRLTIERALRIHAHNVP